MKITIAKNYGFCFGVSKALQIAKSVALDNPNENIFMLNKIVHNQAVVEELKSLGIITLDDSRSLEEKINAIEKGIIIFSAHGHDKTLDAIAINKGLKIVDATCQRVKQNENSIIKAINENRTVVYIGIKNHPETNACLSLNKNIIFLDFFNPDYSLIKKDDVISVHNQTTLIQSELNLIYENINKISSNIEIKNDICFATSLRQNSLDEVTDEDVIFIIGDKISSNSTRLFEVSKKKYPNLPVFQISNIEEIKKIDLSKYKKGFISAGTSTPNSIIEPIIKYLSSN